MGLPDGDLPPDAAREPGHCARRRGQSGRPDRDQRERGRYGADVPARRAGAAAVTRGCLEPSWTTPCVLPSSCLVVQGHEGFGAPLAGMEIDSPWLDKTDFINGVKGYTHLKETLYDIAPRPSLDVCVENGCVHSRDCDAEASLPCTTSLSSAFVPDLYPDRSVPLELLDRV